MLILIFNYYSLNLLTTAFLFLSLKDKDSRIDSLEKELKESRGTITKLQTEVASLNRELCDIARYDGGGGYGGGYGRGAKKTPAKRTAQEEADLAQVKSDIKMNEIAFRKKLDVEVKAEQEANQSRARLNNMHQVNAMAQQVGAQNFMQQQLQNNAMFGMVGSGGGGLPSHNNFQQMGMMQNLAGTYNGPFGNPIGTAAGLGFAQQYAPMQQQQPDLMTQYLAMQQRSLPALAPLQQPTSDFAGLLQRPETQQLLQLLRGNTSGVATALGDGVVPPGMAAAPGVAAGGGGVIPPGVAPPPSSNSNASAPAA